MGGLYSWTAHSHWMNHPSPTNDDEDDNDVIQLYWLLAIHAYNSLSTAYTHAMSFVDDASVDSGALRLYNTGMIFFDPSIFPLCISTLAISPLFFQSVRVVF